MKRHEAIAPLSRDHHSTLILAQLLKKNAPLYRDLPDNAKDKAEYARQQFAGHIKKHFEQEEIILDKVKGVDTALDKLADEIKTEHSEISDLFRTLSATPDLKKTLDTLAIALESHIRKEERVLFPLLQEKCSEDMLQEIHGLLH